MGKQKIIFTSAGRGEIVMTKYDKPDFTRNKVIKNITDSYKVIAYPCSAGAALWSNF